jgi:16S rRNA (adenine1518-N6/adenine1519-N6)-dimethyltransferase
MKKQFGQHFLRQVPKELLFPLDALETIQSLQKVSKIFILEIGPGSGVVTTAVLQQLLPFSHLHITYEVVDIDLEAIQTTEATITALGLPKRIKMIYTHKDILSYKLGSLGTSDFVYIFGALPYNVSKKIVNATKQISLEIKTPIVMLPSRFVLQKEVAEDYVSVPPTAAFLGSDLSYFSEYRKIIKRLPPGAFFPPPKVDSAILEIGWRKWKEQEKTERKLVAKVIRQGFIAKRKVINSVFKSRIVPEKLSPTLKTILQMRAHELSLAEWELVTQSLLTPQ